MRLEEVDGSRRKKASIILTDLGDFQCGVDAEFARMNRGVDEVDLHYRTEQMDDTCPVIHATRVSWYT